MTRTPSSPTRVRLAGLACVLVAAGSLYAIGSSGSDEPAAPVTGEQAAARGSNQSPTGGPTSGPSPTSQATLGPTNGPSGNATSTPANTVEATLIIDGWTAATIAGLNTRADTGGPEILASPATTSSQRALRFQPATAADLVRLRQASPLAATTVAGRMISVDATFKCSPTSCQGARGKVGDTSFLDAAAVPGLGEAYTAHGITSTLYVARMQVPRGHTHLRVVADGWTPFMLRLNAKASDLVGEDGKPLPPDAANGFGQNLFFFAGGLGQFFVPQATWVGGGNPDKPVQWIPRFASASNTSPDSAALSSVPFSTGLAVPAPEALTSELTPSQLTWMTSPTVGCGLGVLCVPGKASPAITGKSVNIKRVCATDDSRATGWVGVIDSTWTLTLAKPTHMIGMWNGLDPAQFQDAGTHKGLWSGTPPLVRGKQTFHQIQVLFFDGPQTTLRAQYGYAAQGGADGAAAMSRVITPAQALTYSDVPYKLC